VRRWLVALLPALLFVLLPAGPANAAFGDIDCKSSPVAQTPGGGTAGFFTPTPDTIPADPEGGAWANDAPMYGNYGLAGLTFNTYDLGCGPDAAKDPGGVINTIIANMIFEVPKVGVAATVALSDIAYGPDFMSVFDPLLVDVTGGLADGVYTRWLPVALVVIGVMLLWGARKGRVSDLAAAVGWAVLVMVIMTAVLRWPTVAGSAADATAADTLGSINTGINGGEGDTDPINAAASSLSNSILYQQWKRGTFGNTDSPTVNRYAKDIYTSQALTWAEAKVVQDDPDGSGKDLLEAKADKWGDTADKIKDEDPDAYQYLTGHRGETRVGAALISIVSAGCVLIFLLLSYLMMLAGFIIVRLAVVFSPVFAVLGVNYAARGAITGVVGVVAAAIINTIAFGTAAAVNVYMAKLLLKPGGPVAAWFGLILMFVIAVLLLFALRPMTRLTRMVTPSKMVGDVTGAPGAVWGTTKKVTQKTLDIAARGATTGLIAGYTAGQTAEMQQRTERAEPRVEAEQGYYMSRYSDDAEDRALPAGGPVRRPVAALPAATQGVSEAPAPEGVQTYGPATPAYAPAAPETDPETAATGRGTPVSDEDMFAPSVLEGTVVDDDDSLVVPVVAMEPDFSADSDVYDVFIPETPAATDTTPDTGR
jgi:hypothetical protein